MLWKLRNRGWLPWGQIRGGFTLMELLIVIAVIAILIAIGSSLFPNFRARARNAERAQFAQELQVAIEKFYDQFGHYPYDFCNYNDGFDDRRAGTVPLMTALQPFLTSNFPIEPLYGSDIPGTPKSGQTAPASPNHKAHWHYVVSGARDRHQHFLLQVELEGGPNNDILQSSDAIRGSVKRYINEVNTRGTSNDTSVSVSLDYNWNGGLRRWEAAQWLVDCHVPTTTDFSPDDGPLLMCGDLQWPGTETPMQYYCVGNVGKRPSAPGTCDGVLEDPVLGLSYWDPGIKKPAQPACDWDSNP